MPSRRDFLKTSAAVGGSVLVGAAAPGLLSATAPVRARAPMRILVLGGTGFIGPHLVKHAVARGHTVTIFTRGRSDDSMLPTEVERLVGDRNGQLGALEGKKWDAVFDDSATNPDWVRQSAGLLKGNVAQYSFTSSTGVYYPYLKKGLDESTPPLLEGDQKDGSAAFGTAKAQCEKIVLDTFGEGGIVVAAVIHRGPRRHDGPLPVLARAPRARWRGAGAGQARGHGAVHRRARPRRVHGEAGGGQALRPLQRRRSVGPHHHPRVRGGGGARARPFGRLRAARQGQVHAGGRLRLPHREQDLSMVPWVIPTGNNFGHTAISNARAKAAGLGFRPIATTVRHSYCRLIRNC
jgi:NAD-dependent epimerase/dehydratase family protein/TAT (twin-arginine translocation) pathway-exported protein